MPDPLREPEFLPDWYRTRITRSRRWRMLVRAGAVVLLAGAAGATLSPGHAPAEGMAVQPVTRPGAVVEPAARADATKLPASPQVPPGARRALQALHEVLPPGVAVDHLAFRNDAGVTHLSLTCSANDAGAGDALADALRALPLFADVRLEPGAEAIPEGWATDKPTRPFHFDVRAAVAAEAR